jgi:hypothetical protein
MTKSETLEVLEVLRRAYPRFLTINDGRELKATAGIWHDFLSQYPKELCQYAIHRHIGTNKFAPSIGEIMEIIHETLEPEKDEATDAWNALQKAAARASIVTPEEFDALPYEVKRFCGSRNGLIQLGRIESEIFGTVTRGQFTKAYEGMRKSREAIEAMPPNIQKLVEGITRPLLDAPR